ncbi:MAG: hypothetical protein HY788_06095 [Deltaproteobacteria bacterium]|nr:hypothetical protein [Deltaproteobacteria bacterium]
MNGILSRIKYNRVTASCYDILLRTRYTQPDMYIFVASTGRCGTLTLASICSALRNSVALHEPLPVMFDDYAPGRDRKQYFESLFYIRKRINIRRSSANKNYYIETNHQFAKNFLPLAVDYFRDRLRIVHLTRDPLSVGVSLYRIHSIPGRSALASSYLISPSDTSNLIAMEDLFSGNGKLNHDICRCLWYWYEVETRITMHKKTYPDVYWRTVTTEDLNNYDSMIQMFASFRIPETDIDVRKLKSAVGRKNNQKLEYKTNRIDVDLASDLHEQLLLEMERRYGKGFWMSREPVAESGLKHCPIHKGLGITGC